tara:strand:+ start:2154 stop:3392 length:1239 start_codon:yes stop_codon:yes gene_type:complete
MFGKKTYFLGIFLYLSLISGYFYGENLNLGAYQDWLNANINPIKDFSNNFVDTFLNYEKYGHRHSPVYLIFLSSILKTGLDIEYVRLIHLHLCLFLVFLFYKCLSIKFLDIDKKLLLLLSLTIFLSPTFRSIAIWPDSRIPGLIFFTLSIFSFLKFNQNNEPRFAWYTTLSLIISAYISPNFSVFIIYFFYFFFKELKISNLVYLACFAFLSSLPMLYYLFVMDVNFLIAGGTQYSEEKGLYYFNLSNKILIISTIFLFHFIPFIYNLLNFKDVRNFLKRKFILILIFFFLLIFFFDYGSEFTGGGVFFQISNFLFENNSLFYLISFFSICLFFYLSKDYSNLLLIALIILSNIQNSIYHKYYEPMFIILIFTLFKNFDFYKFFNKKSNFYFLYLFCLGFIFLRAFKNYYLV